MKHALQSITMPEILPLLAVFYCVGNILCDYNDSIPPVKVSNDVLFNFINFGGLAFDLSPRDGKENVFFFFPPHIFEI